jgi:hypothetical protein
MALYHFEVGFPEGMHFRPVLGLVPTMHAQQARLDDPRGIITLPKAFLPGIAQVIEAETDSNGNIIKVLARQPHDSQNDVVYAFIPASRLIKTAWLQTKTDKHRTLDRSRYTVPPKKS